MVLSNCNSHPKYNNPSNISTKELPDNSEYDSTVLEEAYYKLKANDKLSILEIKTFSKAPEIRSNFYRLLKSFNAELLFPQELYTFEKGAESDLVNWLLFPTELDTIPSKIEFLKKIDHSKDGTIFTYYVFQFRTKEPHWAAKNGWMIGVVGPYFKNSNPYDWTNGTFSRLTKVSEATPEEEVIWTHNNIYEKSPE